MKHRLSSLAAAVLVASSFSVTVFADDSNDRRDEDLRDNGNRSCTSGTGSGSKASRSKNLQVVGLTNRGMSQLLVCFSENNPGSPRVIGDITFLSSGVRLIGIDFRVQDGQLYGVSSDGGVYKFHASYASAVKVSQLTVALDGSPAYGVDFNPAANRLRIVSSKGQNLRHNIDGAGLPTAGTTTDDALLNYLSGTPPAPVTALGVVGSAYTNNDLDSPTATTLYALDSNQDQIAVQSPPNNGTLAATGKLTLNSIDSATAGFDIYSTIRDGLTVDNRALASIKPSSGPSGSPGTYGLYSIDLQTGKATLRGNFPAELPVTDIAVPLNQS